MNRFLRRRLDRNEWEKRGVLQFRACKAGLVKSTKEVKAIDRYGIDKEQDRLSTLRRIRLTLFSLRLSLFLALRFRHVR